ncbi:molybdopterin molybdotransferase MoeA [Sediminitomix flava]|uniref:Molybdopterin molybdenumtransferase n=1 Tax=Sediminitomix flava TaxID=379075 RepID=A0A315ZCP8_SEDFL|nr:molybdopterin molybdotransferase MoeA [Sediminitomix flava]PWJ42873.1 molybdopterin molybdochelatase [Sediminitomix flava]
MISVEEAKELVKQHIKTSDKHLNLPIEKTLNYILAKDLHANISLPPFAQSAMDGYAINIEDFSDEKIFEIQTIIPAGHTKLEKLEKGKAIRIFTGAPIPDGADAIIVQEKAKEENGLVRFDAQELKAMQNIRPIGEQIQKGEVAVAKGTLLTPETLSFIASFGITELCVQKQPQISIFVNGDELIKAGQELEFGQIYESNSLGLKAAVENTNFPVASVQHLPDNKIKVMEAISKATTEMDFLLLSGGISVGDYDYIGSSLRELGCQEIFYKVKQKPGKPLFFGKLNDCYVFALPGNPAASLTCFYEYVLPALHQFSGNGFKELSTFLIPLAHDFKKKGDRAQFLKAKIENHKVSVMGKQASSMLRSFINSSGYVYISAEQAEVKEGELVEVRVF